MALTNAYVQVYGQLPDVFKRIAEGQAPEKFTTQYLKDIGFGSSNFRALIPLLKALGFLTAEGAPTQRYHEYRNMAQSKKIMSDALNEAYSDLFTIKSKPTSADKELIEGKFKSAHNATPNTSKLMANTFFALLSLSDPATTGSTKSPKPAPVVEPRPEPSPDTNPPRTGHSPSLHYNIQIHLPATKDTEVFNAIFRALKEHLLD